ncbi:MAG: DUF4301 family protein [Bacteroidetes bacterium]|nr:DUF4301 family protein [Bacteroidota bacterium]
MFTNEDKKQIEKKGIGLQALNIQLDHFMHGFPFIGLLRPATAGDGILQFGETKKKELIHLFEQQLPTLNVIKFVPASGAASRMFRHLFEFREALSTMGGIPVSYLSDTGFNSVNYFFRNIGKFAFYHDLQLSLKKERTTIDQLIADRKHGTLLDYLLTEKGLDYASLPKALLEFHNYPDGARTAMEEHLVEAALYARGSNNRSGIHFTVSPDHIGKFNKKIAAVRKKYEEFYETRLDTGHSVQKSSTDIIAVDEENLPFRNPDGSLLFRPAGHGALLENLNDLRADIIFIKNIDNIVPDRLKPHTVDHKKLIGGYLLRIRKKIFDFLKSADAGTITQPGIEEMIGFVRTRNLVALPPEIDLLPAEQQISILRHELNRPIRVCGMVKNAGEPGGGPFWVKEKDGRATLQIVESSQVNLKDPAQSKIFNASTHFNPVDLVCCTTDYKGNAFNLHDFVDTETGFISLKSSGGKTLKAQELPGLWNGSMARWITVFAEVPLITFNPVKTINDLLRDEHQ